MEEVTSVTPGDRKIPRPLVSRACNMPEGDANEYYLRLVFMPGVAIGVAWTVIAGVVLVVLRSLWPS